MERVNAGTCGVLARGFRLLELGSPFRDRLARRYHESSQASGDVYARCRELYTAADLGSGLWPLWLFTILFTAIDASFPIVWATIGDFFGRKSFATIRGTMAFFYTWGSVLGPVIAGAVYDHSQSYISTLWGLSAILLLGAVLTALMIKPWDNIRLSRIGS